MLGADTGNDDVHARRAQESPRLLDGRRLVFPGAAGFEYLIDRAFHNDPPAHALGESGRDANVLIEGLFTRVAHDGGKTVGEHVHDVAVEPGICMVEVRQHPELPIRAGPAGHRGKVRHHQPGAQDGIAACREQGHLAPAWIARGPCGNDRNILPADPRAHFARGREGGFQGLPVFRAIDGEPHAQLRRLLVDFLDLHIISH